MKSAMDPVNNHLRGIPFGDHRLKHKKNLPQPLLYTGAGGLLMSVPKTKHILININCTICVIVLSYIVRAREHKINQKTRQPQVIIIKNKEDQKKRKSKKMTSW